jgi:cytoskeletal protein CcmA (bactofilin family)
MSATPLGHSTGTFGHQFGHPLLDDHDDHGHTSLGWLPRPRRRDIVIMIVIALILGTLFALVPTTVYGAELRQGDTIVVPPDETINDDLYAFGQTVTIQGTVNGDIFAGGQTVTISGRVAGDVMAAGSSVVVSGPVAGSVRLGGQTVEIMAPIDQDVLAGAATVTVGPSAQIGRDVLAGGNTIAISGPVGRSIRAGSDQLIIAGPVGGDVLAQVGSLRLANGAGIAGSLSYTSAQEAIIEPGATVSGMTTHVADPATPAAPSPAAQFGYAVLGWFKALVGVTVYGLLLVLLFPQMSQRATDTMRRSPWASLGLGFAVLVGVPVAALLLFVVGLLVGGWWIGLLAGVLYLALLPLGYAIVGLYLGQLVLQRAGRAHLALAWHLMIGLVLLGLVSIIPLAGGMILLFALLFGLGAFVIALADTYRGQPRPAVEPVAQLPHDLRPEAGVQPV